MDINYSYYDINLVDIWLYEHYQYISGKSSNDLAKKVIDKAEHLIINEGEESFVIELGVNISERSRSYYHRNINEYKRASKTLKGRFDVNYFFNKDSCFEYEQQIIINRDNPDFDFWFSLKLRQYASKLISIKHFLDFQLDDKFDNDSSKFIDFLKLVIKQNYDTIFDDRITQTVDTWIIEKNALNRKIKGKYVSLRIKELASNPNYFQKNNHNFNSVHKQLIENSFIHKNTLLTDFKRIFEDVRIPESKRIIWTGTNKELQWFMNYLSKESNKIEYHKDDIWVVANTCFVDKEGKEIGIDSLRKANGKNIERKNMLESILAKI